MEYIVILVVLLIMIAAGFNGYKRGFVNIALTLVSALVAILLSSMLAKPVAGFIKEKTPLYNTIEGQINEYISDYMGKNMDRKATELSSEMLDKLPVPESFSKMLVENNTASVIKELNVETIGEYISAEFATIIVNAISYIALFIAINLILRIVISILDIVARLPVVKDVNRTLGLLVGLAEGLILVWMCALIVTALAGTEAGQEIMKQISDNSLLTFIYRNNPLMNLLK